jgi:hypothetical protein
MFSTPLNVMVVSILFHVVEGGFADRRAAALAGLLMGALPMLSAHSYIGVGEYAIFLCLSVLPRRRRAPWRDQIVAWGCFGAVALAVSLPQIAWLMRAHRANFMKIDPIHRETDKRWVAGFFAVWWASLGSFLVAAVGLVFFTNDARQTAFYRPSIGVWIVSNLIRYQPGAMDNTKVFFAGWYSLACVAVANFVVVTWKQGGWQVRVALCAMVAGFSFGGAVCIWKALFSPFTMFSGQERDVGIWMMHNAKKDAAVLAGGWHGNTLMSLAGKLVTMGYGGWVWTHGLNIDARRAFMSELIRNRENVSVFAEHKIEYAVLREDDKSRKFYFPEPEPSSRWLLLFDLGNFKVYRILKT